MRAGAVFAAACGLAAAAGVAGARSPGPAPAEKLTVIESFDDLKPGEAPATLGGTGVETSTAFDPPVSAKVVAGGFEGTRCLRIAGSIPGGAFPAWILERARSLASAEGVRFHVKSSPPLLRLQVRIRAGGVIWAETTTGAEWREVRIPFSDCPGFGRFDPKAFKSIEFAVVRPPAGPFGISIDGIAAWMPRRPALPARVSLERSFEQPALLPGERRVLNSLISVGVVEDSAVYSFWKYRPPWDVIRVSFRQLPHDYRKCDAVSVSFRARPSEPAVIAKLFLREAGGEEFMVLRDAPAEPRETIVPIDEFTPDAAGNIRLPEGSADGRLDLGKLADFGIELYPATREIHRGTLVLGEAWALRRGKVRKSTE